MRADGGVALTAETDLCAFDDIPDPGAKGPFAVTIAGERKAVFVVRMGRRVTAFVNSCPHVGAPLEAEPDHFLDLTGTEIICAMHGARFDPESGQCRWGPCRGKRLESYAVTLRNGRVIGVATLRNGRVTGKSTS